MTDPASNPPVAAVVLFRVEFQDAECRKTTIAFEWLSVIGFSKTEQPLGEGLRVQAVS